MKTLFPKNNILLTTRLLCVALALAITIAQILMSKILHSNILIHGSVGLSWFLGLLVVFDNKTYRKFEIPALVLFPIALFVANAIRRGFSTDLLTWFLMGWAPALLVLVVAKIPIRQAYKNIVLAAMTCFVARILNGLALNGHALFNAMDAVVCSIMLTWLIGKYKSINPWLIFLLFTISYAPIFIVAGHYMYYLRSLVPSMVAMTLAVLIAVSKIGEKVKWAMGILTLAAIIAAVEVFDKPFFNYLYSTTEEGRLESSVINDNLQPVLRLTKPDGTSITAETLRGKTVFLYLWSRGCAQCHALMPLFSEMAEAAKTDTSKVYMAVYLPYKNDDFSQYDEARLQNDYAFQWAAADTSNTIMQDLRFNGVPHLTILDKEGTVVYNGYPDKEEVQRFERKHRDENDNANHLDNTEK